MNKLILALAFVFAGCSTQIHHAVRNGDTERVKELQSVASTWNADGGVGSKSVGDDLHLVAGPEPLPSSRGDRFIRDLQPAVQKLQTLATKELSDATLRDVQQTVFPNK